jgi:peptidyl-prolyl cis-trans isomerase B (cyclophilin B)
MKKFTMIILAGIFAVALGGAAFADDYEPQESCDGCPQYKITVTHGGEPMGEIIVETFPEVAPKHARNFDSLVSIGFYDGTAFHRVIPGFMIQGGDPNSKNKPKSKWGFGDPSQRKIPAEFNDIHHGRGILSAARSQNPNSATSQFFIMVDDASQLDNKYTVYGQVLEGMATVDEIVGLPRDSRNNPQKKVEMQIVRIQK